MTSSDHAQGHVTHSEKMQRLPSILIYHHFSLDLVFIMLCKDFVSFLKGQILREFQLEKILNFLKIG